MAMRIIAGEWRGRPIVAPAGDTTRPTADRTRETLFSMLTSRLGGFTDRHVIDLFAGSGALGLEALSRGAATCRFVERDRAALTALTTNVTKLGAAARATILPASVETLRLGSPLADIIMVDPPYRQGDPAVLLSRIRDMGWLAPDGWISYESAHGEPVMADGLTVRATRDVGKARLTLLTLDRA